MRLFEYPKQLSVDDYESRIRYVVDKLTSRSDFVSAYQIGSVGDPGISDVDIVAVLDGSVETDDDPRSGLDSIGKYVFCHPLFGVTPDDFARAKDLTLFSNYQHLAGDVLPTTGFGLGSEDRKTLQIQIALEYLLRMVVNMSVTKKFQILKVRNLLLNAKAIEYDLEFLGTESGSLFDQIQIVKEMRCDWFLKQPSSQSLENWFYTTYTLLCEYVSEQLEIHPFYLMVDDKTELRLTPNIRFVKGNAFSVQATGVTLPSICRRFGRNYIRVQHRLAKFSLELPFISDAMPPIVYEYLTTQRRLRTLCNVRLKNFMALATSLNVT